MLNAAQKPCCNSQPIKSRSHRRSTNSGGNALNASPATGSTPSTQLKRSSRVKVHRRLDLCERKAQDYNPDLILQAALRRDLLRRKLFVHHHRENSGDFMAGSPRSVWALWLRQWCCAAVLTLTAPLTASAAAPRDETSQEVRIRLEWTGDRPEIFAGVLETSQGTFASPVSLSPEADHAGTLWADRQNLWLRSRSPRRRDGFDVTLRASGTARIHFTLQIGDQNGRSRHFDWKLADVGRDPIIFALATGRVD